MVHGGDIYRNKVKIDFSVNVNPLGIPGQVQQSIKEAADHCIWYPDPQTEELKKAIAEMTGMNENCILCGNGASELFLSVVHAVKPKKTMIPIPAFSGYEYAAAAADSQIIFYKTQEEDKFKIQPDFLQLLDSDIDLLFLANPNNPTGSLGDRQLLIEIVSTCLEKEIIVVMDECFIEFTGKEQAHSFKREITAYPNLIVVRAFTKTYAIPGVRLGFLFCADQKLLHQINRQLPEWNISVIAQHAGICACKERTYLQETIAYLQEERRHLVEGLEKQGITVYPSDTNFLLMYTNIRLYDRLLEEQILIRDCSNFRGLEKGYYRIAVKTKEENRVLLNAIMAMKDVWRNLK